MAFENWLALTLAAIQGILYVLVGRQVIGRTTQGRERWANLAFGAWWVGLGALVLAGGGMNALGRSVTLGMPVYQAYINVVVLVLCAALAGLVYYFVFLFTGRAAWAWPVAAFHLGLFALITYVIAAANPVAVAHGAWRLDLVYEHEVVSTSTGRAVAMLLLAPAVVGALGYLSLFFRLNAPLQRYRIVMVAGGVLVWFTIAIVATVAGWTDARIWPAISGLFGTAAAVAALLAFRPPRPVLKRWGAREAAT